MDLAIASPEALKAPQSPDIPELPSDGFWTETQWVVFMALMDCIVPAIVAKSSLVDKNAQLGITDSDYSAVLKTAQTTALEKRSEGSLKAFLEDKPSANPTVRKVMVRIVARLPPKHRDGLGGVLSGLSYVFTPDENPS